MAPRPALAPALLALAALASAPAGAVTFRTVALTGQEAPGTEGARFGEFLRLPVLNNAGQTAFNAELEQGTGDVTDENNDDGIWSEGSGALKLVAREGDEAPGTGGTVFTVVDSSPSFNNLGQTAFQAFFNRNEINEGIWSEAGGELATVARTGDEAPLTNGSLFYRFSEPDLNDAGQTAFPATLEIGTGNVDAGNDTGLWRKRSFLGDPLPVAREGDRAPGAEPRRFTEFAPFGLVLNDAGNVAYPQRLEPDGDGVWSDFDSVSVDGDTAPGTDGQKFTRHGIPALNNNGATAFPASRTTEPPPSFCCQGVWSEAGGSLEPVVQEGEEAAGTGGETFGGPPRFLFDLIGLNDAGQITFTAFTENEGGDTRNSVFGPDGEGGVTLFFGEGETLPELPAGLMLSDTFQSLEIDESGGLGVLARLEDDTGALFGDTILYAADADTRTVVITTGDELEGRLVDRLRMNRSGFNGQRILNDARQMVFVADFTDGSQGIFVATIPEPGTALLLAAGLAGLAAARRRGR